MSWVSFHPWTPSALCRTLCCNKWKSLEGNKQKSLLGGLRGNQWILPDLTSGPEQVKPAGEASWGRNKAFQQGSGSGETSPLLTRASLTYSWGRRNSDKKPSSIPNVREIQHCPTSMHRHTAETTSASSETDEEITQNQANGTSTTHGYCQQSFRNPIESCLVFFFCQQW